ncbi:MAG: PIN domain-containing protein [Candidatus Diapherotrites archaeon]
MKGTENFLDSYALIEILRGNPRYAAIAEYTAVSTVANLVEVAYCLLYEFPKEKVSEMVNSLGIKVLDVRADHVMQVAEFRKEHSKKGFSYIDCIGYVLAKESRLPFVTGDRQFEGMPNVEFIK